MVTASDLRDRDTGRGMDGPEDRPGPEDDDRSHRSDDEDGGADRGSSSSSSYRSQSQSRSSNTGGGKSGTVLSMEEAIPMLARSETKAVRRLRALTLAILLLVAGICCAAVYIYTRRVEKAAFQEEYTSNGLKVIRSFQTDAYTKMEGLHSLSNSLTAYALEGNLTWPYVTIDTGAYILEPYLSVAGAAAITILPIVPADQRAEWEAYSVAQQSWIEQFLEARIVMNYTNAINDQRHQDQNKQRSLEQEVEVDGVHVNFTDTISPYIKNDVGIDLSPGPWFVWWQYAPVVPDTYYINFNRLASPGFSRLSETLVDGRAAIGNPWIIEPGLDAQASSEYTFVNEMLEAGGYGSYGVGEPLSYMYYPIFQTFSFKNPKVVAVLEGMVYWRSYFEHVLPEKVCGMVVVVKNNNNKTFTYEINGRDAVFLGNGDAHASDYDHMMMRADYTSFQDPSVETESGRQYEGVDIDDVVTRYWIEVYPSDQMQAVYLTKRPLYYTLAMVFFFALTTSIFLLYDWYVERRQRIVLTSALKSNAVVASIFPKNVRDRLLENADVSGANTGKTEEFALDQTQGLIAKSSKSIPIADFYPDTTVYFADIRGFTAWASTREPAQVFTLLETIYNAFDDIAKRRRVFKVETVGDCYMAVCGLPEPRKDHAVAMARFARDSLSKFNELVRKLETSLGPDTGDLCLRTGLHSGPVTGGVIRGENARFQLFGDTVNTAARMESTGIPGRIQVSQETADLLIQQGKSRWLVAREDEVLAKGKGIMRTYWLSVTDSHSGSSQGRSSCGSSENATEEGSEFDEEMGPLSSSLEKTEFDEKTARLVSWNVDLLSNILKEIVAQREIRGRAEVDLAALEKDARQLEKKEMHHTIEEVREIISLPEYDDQAALARKNASSIVLDPRVVHQLHSYVHCLAAMYRNNFFHNFEHASHVTMSVSKLLARIVKPANLHVSDSKETHDYTYGITSDPLTQFSCVLAALIHDVDHPGVPNAQLVKEGTQLAEFYKGKSVAEQNSVDLAWELLMDDSYSQLRATIYSNEPELTRFRALIVNTVMATDIVDKDLKALRDARWERAFSESATHTSSKTDIDRKATIVMEHLIQASDVAHTMQHWHIYRKWNERFFMECYKAYKDGRAASDPSLSWYEGEKGFFDFYIIPLAKKLKDCGVFGVSSDEYLSYALRNREEWDTKGQAIVAEMIQNANKILRENTRRASSVSTGSKKPSASKHTSRSPKVNRGTILESSSLPLVPLTPQETADESLIFF